MGTIEILPDLLIRESGSKTLVGAASSLLCLNDGLDSSYVRLAGAVSQNWSAIFRFTSPTIPANSAIEKIQMKVRYSNFTKSSTTYEKILPGTILIGRQVGTAAPIYDGYSVGETMPSYSIATTATDWIGPFRDKFYTGKYFLGERYQMLTGRRIYGSIGVSRKTAVNLARVYALSLIVTYNEQPVITLNEPSGTEVIARPKFEWDTSDPEGDFQQVYDARVYTQAVANNPLFDLNNLTKYKPVYRASVVSSAPEHQPVDGYGANGDQLAAFVQVRHRVIWVPGTVYRLGTAILSPYSNWVRSDFTLSIAVPKRPGVTATYDTSKNNITVHVQGYDNQLDFDASTFETQLWGWTAGASTTIARTNAVAAANGSYTMSLTRTGTVGDATASVNYDLDCMAGNTYTAIAYFRSAATVRTTGIVITWYDTDYNVIGTSTNSYRQTETTTGWRPVWAWGVAPAMAMYARMTITVTGCAVNEVHYVDQIGFMPGLFTTQLTENQASLETDTSGWNAGTNVTIARDTTQFMTGAASLRMTRTTSTGDAFASTPSGTGGIPATPSTQFTWSAKFKAATTARNCLVVLWQYDAAGALITSTNSAIVTDATSVWTTVTGTVTIGATTQFVALTVTAQACAVGESHYVDAIGLWPGAVVGEIYPWNQGGFPQEDPDLHQMQLQKSIKNDADGNPVWVTLPEQRVTHDPMMQTLDYYDYEVPSNTTASYRARIQASNADGDMMNSGWSPIVTALMPGFFTWWLRDPLAPGTRNMPISVTQATLDTPKPNSVEYPVGSDTAVMSHLGTRQDNITVTVNLLNETDYVKFREMVDSGYTLLLQDIHGQQWYVQADQGASYEMLMLAKNAAEPWVTRHAHRATVHFISVDPPARYTGELEATYYG